MKRYQIVLFLFSVIAVLAVICAVFPADGWLGLRFPQLSSVLSAAEPDTGPSPEELLEQRMQAILAAERDQYQAFFREDPSRFYLPEGDIRFFDPLFAALDRAGTTPVRIVHYGDSQIEEDRITGTIRESLQKRFGGSGPGMMPARRRGTQRVGGSSSATLSRFYNFGDASHRAGIRKYGPFADFTRLDTISLATFSFYPVKGKSKEQSTFDRMTLVAGNLRGPLSVTSQGVKQVVEPGESISFVRFELPDSSARASLTVSGFGDLYGILLDSKTGVRMDNVPMRGCSGTIFTTMDEEQLRTYYREENVRLILLQYGGNSMPYLKTDKGISTYAESIRKQIRFLQKQAPDARIIFMGPSDMATVVDGKRQTYPKLPAVVDSLRTAANDCGAAYWDIYGVMGGENSMVKWVQARPALAGSDYVHFTLAGAQRVGELFSESLMLYYEYYRWRKEHGR